MIIIIYSAFIIICISQSIVSTLINSPRTNIEQKYLSLDCIYFYLLGMDNVHGVDIMNEGYFL